MPPVKISIIIPTLNEELLLPVLLESLNQQSFKDFEIIVADASSKDKTRQIAQEFGAKIVAGGLPGLGRNNGAKIALGEYFLFLDADVKLDPNFLTDLINKITVKKIKVGSCWFSPLSNKLSDILMHGFFNYYDMATQFFYPHAPGFCIFCKKEIHQKIQGFNETLLMGEDHDYVKRAAKLGKFRFLFRPKLYSSVRRFETDGRLNVFLNYTFYEFYRWFIGDKKTKIFKYDFGHHQNQTDQDKLISK